MKKAAPILNAEIHGTGPTVVLLHGFLSSAAYWRKVSQIVSEKKQVIAIDLLGFGGSPKPFWNRYDYHSHIASINATLEHHNVKTFTLVGHSMGALISLRYANQYPDRVTELILANMPITIGAKQAKKEYFSTGLMHRLGLTPVVHTLTWTIVRTLYKMNFLPSHVMKIFQDNDEYVFKHRAFSRFRSFHKVIVNAKTDIDLAKVTVKTTILAGVEDRRVYLDNLLNHIQLDSRVVLESVQTGHHIPRLMPEIIAKKIS